MRVNIVKIDKKEDILYGAKYEDSSFNQRVFYKLIERIEQLEARIKKLEGK